MIIQGDCIEKLKELPDNSVDSVVTDPPYGIGFMGKEWDNFKPETINAGMNKEKRKKSEIASTRISNIAGTYDLSKTGMTGFQKWCTEWAIECLRVLKPGGHILVCGGTRTYHRMACAIEDAGFEIRDMVEWVYGSGFPKSLNIGKKVKEYEGWGTALKPAHEPIVLARKPLSEKTVAQNVLKHGTGGINIDGCRVATNELTPRNNKIGDNGWKNSSGGYIEPSPLGRFPANLIHDGSEEVVSKFPDTKSGKMGAKNTRHTDGSPNGIYGKFDVNHPLGETYGDSGSAARFFYCAKASKSERNKGCEGLETKQTTGGGGMNNTEDDVCGKYGSIKAPAKNNHPTVKPISLMRYLCRLVTPKGGTVLDPFMGSGSTGVAAKIEGFDFIGIDKEAEYIKIAEARIKAWKKEREQKQLI